MFDQRVEEIVNLKFYAHSMGYGNKASYLLLMLGNYFFPKGRDLSVLRIC